jgi:thiamine-monophosphate kinase
MTLNEDDIVQCFAHLFRDSSRGMTGIGDDAAVLPSINDEHYVISKDLLVENIHFRLSYFDPEGLAHKALHANLSDIAAMGARPAFLLLGLAIPPTLDHIWVRRFSEALANECHRQKVGLIGGDTTASLHDLFISITVVGRAPRATLKYRTGAESGDVVCVVGELGEAYCGFKLLEGKQAGFKEIKAKSLCPMALVQEGLWLGGRSEVKAMMDISDGLFVDFGRLAEKSGVGGVIDLNSLKPSPHLKAACSLLNIEPVECVLVGGEDYALLFAVAANDVELVSREFESVFSYKPNQIGFINAGQGIRLMQNGVDVPWTYKAFSHFGEN